MAETNMELCVSGIHEKWIEPKLYYRAEPVRVWLDFDAPARWMSLGKGIELASEVGRGDQLKMLGPSITLTVCAPVHPDPDEGGERFISDLPNFLGDASGRNYDASETHGLISQKFVTDSVVAHKSTGMPALMWNGLDILDVSIFSHIKNVSGPDFQPGVWFMIFDKRDESIWRFAIGELGLNAKFFSIGGYGGGRLT